MNKTGITLILILVTLLTPSCKKGSDQETDLQGAVITSFQGSITLIDNSQKSWQLQAEDLYTKKGLLMQGYQLRSGPSSYVDMELAGSIRVRVGEKSHIKLDRAQILTGEDFQQVLFELKEGRLYTSLGKLGAASRYGVVTPTSAAMVRGTEFLVKQEKGVTETLVSQGAVAVTGEDEASEQIVGEDEKAVVSADGDVKVSSLESGDREEIGEMSENLEGSTGEGMKRIRTILESFDEQKSLIKETIKEQMRKDREMLEKQKETDRINLEEQKEKGREALERVKEETDKAGEEILQSGKEAIEDSTESVKSDLEKLKARGKEKLLDDDAKNKLNELRNK